MTDINQFITALNKQVKTKDHFKPADLIRVADSLKDPKLIAAVDKIVNETSVLNAVDKNHDGFISSRELLDIAKLSGSQTELTVDGLDTAVKKKAPARKDPTTGLPSTAPRSTPLPTPSSPTSGTSTAASPDVGQPGTAPNDIEQFVNGIKHQNEYHFPGASEIEKTISLQAIKLDSIRTAKIAITPDGQLHILIFSGENFTSENLIKEYTLPVQTLRGILDKQGYFLELTRLDKLNSENNRIPQGKTRLSLYGNPSSNDIETLTKIIQGNLLNDPNLTNLQKISGVSFRQGRGVAHLGTSIFGKVPPAPQISKTIIPIDSLPAYLNRLEASGKKGGERKHREGTISKGDWVSISGWGSDSKSSAAAQFYKVSYKDASGVNKYIYRMLMAYDVTKPDGSKACHRIEYQISPYELERIAQRDGANINTQDAESTRKWFLTHFKFEDNALEAYTQREQGFAQFGECSFKYRRGEGSTPEEAIENLYQAGKDASCWSALSNPDHPIRFANGSLPQRKLATTDSVRENITSTKIFFKSALRGADTFLTKDSAGEWKTNIVIQDQYSTVYYWKDNGECYEFVVTTERILNYLKEKTGRDFSDITPSKFKDDAQHRDLWNDFLNTFAYMIDGQNNPEIYGRDRYFRHFNSTNEMFTAGVTEASGANQHSTTSGFRKPDVTVTYSIER